MIKRLLHYWFGHGVAVPSGLRHRWDVQSQRWIPTGRPYSIYDPFP